MAKHSSIFAWRIPWTEEPGGLQSVVFKELDTTKHAFPNKIKSNLFFSFAFGLVPLAHRMLSEASHLVLQTSVPCGKWESILRMPKIITIPRTSEPT